jgi:hypothetical protein
LLNIKQSSLAGSTAPDGGFPSNQNVQNKWLIDSTIQSTGRYKPERPLNIGLIQKIAALMAIRLRGTSNVIQRCEKQTGSNYTMRCKRDGAAQARDLVEQRRLVAIRANGLCCDARLLPPAP